MAKVHIEDEIAASAAAVWELVRDFGGVQRWSPEIARCELEGSGIGAVRHIETSAFTVRERLEQLDEDARTMRYSIVESPIPFADYVSTIVVTAIGPHRARISWSSTFEPAGMPEEQLRQLVETIYRQGLDGMRRALHG